MQENNKRWKWHALAILYSMTALQAATQIFAWQFNWHPDLGFNIEHVYPFWMFLIWLGKYFFVYPRELQLGILVLSAFVFVLFFVTYGVPDFNFKKSEEESDLYGSSHFATKKDIINAKLMTPPGKEPAPDAVIIGGWEEKKWWGETVFHLLRHSGPEHILMMAPTRSGKGVSAVMPTLLSWSESLVVNDLKGELWASTSGWRQKYANNYVLKFEPASKDSVHFNPLDSIRLGPSEIGDAQNIAMLLVDYDGKGLNDHWRKTAFSLITGVILYLIHEHQHFHGERATLPLVLTTLSKAEQEIFTPRGPIESRSMNSKKDEGGKVTLWDAMRSYQNFIRRKSEEENSEKEPTVDNSTGEKKKIDIVSASAITETALDILATPPEERGSIISTAKSCFNLYRDTIVAENISESEFAIKDIMNSDRPVSFYLVTQPSDKDRLNPLVRIVVNSIVRMLTDKMKYEGGRAFGDYKHRLLLMLDEFPSMGRLPIIEESLAYVAGYGIKCFLICQDMTQLKKAYGEQESISSNCHITVVFAPNRADTAEYITRRIGKTTIVKSEGLGKNKTPRYYQRDLLTPDEIMRLKQATFDSKNRVEDYGEIIVLVAGSPPIKGRQPLYYVDKNFSARSKIPAPLASSMISRSQPPLFDDRGL